MQQLPPAKEATRPNKTNLSGVIGLMISLVVVWFFLPDRWTDSIKYSIKYDVDRDQVHWNDKPTDCDFMHAPLGDKGCHYKKTVTAYNAGGNPVAGDDAPKYSKNSYGNTIVSSDDGKSWSLSETPTSDLTVKSVEINWVRVEE